MAGEKHDIRESIPADLGLLLDALRTEFDAKITTLKLWGCVMCLCGGTIGGLLSKFAPQQSADALGLVYGLFT